MQDSMAKEQQPAQTQAGRVEGGTGEQPPARQVIRWGPTAAQVSNLRRLAGLGGRRQATACGMEEKGGKTVERGVQAGR